MRDNGTDYTFLKAIKRTLRKSKLNLFAVYHRRAAARAAAPFDAAQRVIDILADVSAAGFLQMIGNSCSLLMLGLRLTKLKIQETSASTI